MPNVTVYIRRADLEKFKALPNKAEFISNALNEGFWGQGLPPSEPLQPELNKIARAAVQPKEEGVIPMTTAQPIIKTKEDAVETVKQLFPDAQVIEPLYRNKKKGKL